MRWTTRVVSVTISLATLLGSLLLFLPASQASWPTPAENRAMELAVDSGGQPWAVWEVDEGDDANVAYSRWTGQAWQPPQPLSSDPDVWEGTPSLAFTADGTPWAAWSVSPEPGQSSIYVSSWTGQAWSMSQQVSATGAVVARQPVLAGGPDGTLWLAWIGHDGTDREVIASRWDGLAWSVPQQVGTDDTDPLAYDAQPRLAVNSSGQAWLLWVSHEGPLNDEIHASYWDGKGWSPQQQVNSADDTPDVWPSVGLDAKGQPWVAWQGTAGEQDDRWRIYLSRWDATRAAWANETMVSSPASLTIDERRPSLAFAADGQLHLAWSVSGALSGIAHTTWAGGDWAPVTWTETTEPVEAPVVIAWGHPNRDGASQEWLAWLQSAYAVPLAPDGSELAPIQYQPVESATAPLAQSLPPSPAAPVTANYVSNRYLAHGDSITCGCYTDSSGQPVTPYTTLLDTRLDSSVAASEVINSGLPGEKARGARERLKASLLTYTPQYGLIMEGTNDAKVYSAAESAWAVRLLIMDAKSTLPGIQVVMANLIPRLDQYKEDIVLTNHELVRVAAKERVPLADQWQAYIDYGPYQALYVDLIHPGTPGFQVIANTFFQTMLNAGILAKDSVPPTAQIASLPAQSECTAVTISWAGDDGGGSGIGSYDVQIQDNGGPWTDWLLQTPNSSATYVGVRHGHTVGFRVRARDKVGNVGTFSAPATTAIKDTTPPQSAGVLPLPSYQIAPFVVGWWASDLCSQVVKYDVQTRIGSGPWTPWLTQTTNRSGTLDPPSPQCGQTYAFQVRAYDAAGNGPSAWSKEMTATTLACHGASGTIQTVRETPIYNAQLSASPDALWASPSDAAGSYSIYFSEPGTFHIFAERAGFGALPARQNLAVTGHVAGVDFYLPPLDDRVDNGGFEAGDWGAWQRTGSNLPVRTATAHTGHGAVLLDPDGGDSHLSQPVILPAGLTQPTLSLMVRLAEEAGPAAKLKIQIAGTTTISDDLEVPAGGWHHTWYDLSALAGQTVDLTLAVTGSPAVIVDEVSLGSALPGVHRAHLPLVSHSFASGPLGR